MPSPPTKRSGKKKRGNFSTNGFCETLNRAVSTQGGKSAEVTSEDRLSNLEAGQARLFELLVSIQSQLGREEPDEDDILGVIGLADQPGSDDEMVSEDDEEIGEDEFAEDAEDVVYTEEIGDEEEPESGAEEDDEEPEEDEEIGDEEEPASGASEEKSPSKKPSPIRTKKSTPSTTGSDKPESRIEERFSPGGTRRLVRIVKKVVKTKRVLKKLSEPEPESEPESDGGSEIVSDDEESAPEDE
jgi:hypothetical protein